MKKLTKVSEELKVKLMSAHERALANMVKGRKLSTIIPIHSANMQIKFDDGHVAVVPTIIPELAIYLNEGKNSDGKISRDSIGYHITYNNATFPLGHVYGSSGYLCLGNIFVPSMVPEHSPQLPLETLFLHNDRHTGHGNPVLPMTKNQKNEVLHILSYYFTEFQKTEKPINLYVEKYIKRDTLWQIGNYVLNNAETRDMAFDIMTQVFKVVFTKQKP